MDFAGITAVYGRPGAGKTVFAARMAHRRLSAGERVLWATFYEDRQTLVDAMARLGYDLSGAEVWEAVLTDPTSTFNKLSHIVSHSPPNLLVLDSITQLQGIDVRANVTNLIYRVFKFAGIDAVIVSEEPVGALGHIADNLVRLSLEITPRGIAVRRAYVEKSRGGPAGYVKEFEIVEGRGLVFLDELSPAPREAPSRLAPGVPKLDEYLEGARSALVVGGPEATALAAGWAAALARSGVKVLFRTYRGAAPKAAGAVVDVLSADPKTYGRHIYDLVQRVEEVGAEVVFYDGIEAEAFAYGTPHAASLNARKLAVLSKAGVAAVLSGARSLGLASAVDVAAKASGGSVAFSRPYFQPLLCKLEGPLPQC
ncbi:MAG: RAD55 family ATPase, partial [Thermoproteus sp.]